MPGRAEAEVLNEKERVLLKTISLFPEIVKEAGTAHSPAVVANYVYDLVKEFNSFYHDFSILNEPDVAIRDFRLVMTQMVGKIIKNGFSLLGIQVPERILVARSVIFYPFYYRFELTLDHPLHLVF